MRSRCYLRLKGELRKPFGRLVNQVEIYFSILKRKVLTPADAASLDDLAADIVAFQAYYEVRARPFESKFTRADLAKLLQRLASKETGRLPGAA